MYTLGVHLNGSLWCNNVAPVIGKHGYSVLVTPTDRKLWCSHVVTFARQRHEIKEKLTKSMENMLSHSMAPSPLSLLMRLVFRNPMPLRPCGKVQIKENSVEKNQAIEHLGKVGTDKLMGPQRKCPEVLRELVDGIVRLILIIFERSC